MDEIFTLPSVHLARRDEPTRSLEQNFLPEWWAVGTGTMEAKGGQVAADLEQGIEFTTVAPHEAVPAGQRRELLSLDLKVYCSSCNSKLPQSRLPNGTAPPKVPLESAS